MITKSIEIKLPGGLEARPVAELVQLASRYDSTLHIEAQSKKVNAKSFNLNKANKKLRFHKLAKGKYYYRVRVHGQDLQTTRLLNKAFTVK